MKQVLKLLAVIAALAAAAAALLLALDREQDEKYISIYDTDDDRPF